MIQNIVPILDLGGRAASGMQCAVAGTRLRRNGPDCVFADLLRMQKALFIQPQKTLSWPTVSDWTCFAFFIGPLVQNIYSLSLYQDHTLRTYSEPILPWLTALFSLCFQDIFLLHLTWPFTQTKVNKTPFPHAFVCACFLAGSSNHLGFQTLG